MLANMALLIYCSTIPMGFAHQERLPYRHGRSMCCVLAHHNKHTGDDQPHAQKLIYLKMFPKKVPRSNSVE